MQELGLLDEKRQQLGLSAEEEARYAQLLAFVGQAPQPGGWDSGYGQSWGGGEAGLPQAPWNDGQGFGPDSQQWDPNAQQWDPNAQQQWDPNAQQQWDPNAQPQWDPNAQPQWDPNAQPQWDPNAQPQQWDPNAQQQWAPVAQPQWDPNAQAFHPDDVQQQWQELEAPADLEGAAFAGGAAQPRPEDSLPTWPGYEAKPDPAHAWLSDGAASSSPWAQPGSPSPERPTSSVPDGSASLSLANEIDLPGLETTPEWMNPSPVPMRSSDGRADEGDAFALDLGGFGDDPGAADASGPLDISPLSAPISTPLPDQADLLDRAFAGASATASTERPPTTDAEAIDVSDADIMEVSDDDVSFVDEAEIAAPVPEAPRPAAAQPVRQVRIGGASKPGGASAVDALASTFREGTPAPAAAELVNVTSFAGGASATQAPSDSTPAVDSPSHVVPSTPTAVETAPPLSAAPLEAQDLVLDAGDLEFAEPDELASTDTAPQAATAPSESHSPSMPESPPDADVEFDSRDLEVQLAPEAPQPESGDLVGALPEAMETPSREALELTYADQADAPVARNEPEPSPSTRGDTGAIAGSPNEGDATGAEEHEAFSSEIALDLEADDEAPAHASAAGDETHPAAAHAPAGDVADDAPTFELGAEDLTTGEPSDAAPSVDVLSTAAPVDSSASEISLEFDGDVQEASAPIELGSANDPAVATDISLEFELPQEASDEIELEAVGEGGLAPATAPAVRAEVQADSGAAAVSAAFTTDVASSASHRATATGGLEPVSTYATSGDAPAPPASSLVEDWSAAARAQAGTPAIDAFVSAVQAAPTLDTSTFERASESGLQARATGPAPSTGSQSSDATAVEELELDAHPALETDAQASRGDASPLPAEMFEPLVPEAIVPEEQLAYAPQPVDGEIELTEDPRVFDALSQPTEIELQEIPLGDGVQGEVAGISETVPRARRVIDDLDLSGDASAPVPLAPTSDFITADDSGRQPGIALGEAGATDVVIGSSSLAELANAPAQVPAESEEIELELEGLAPAQPLSGEIELPLEASTAPASPVSGEIDLGSTLQELEPVEEIELTGPLAPGARALAQPRGPTPTDASPDADALVAIELSADDVDASETIELGAADLAVEEPGQAASAAQPATAGGVSPFPGAAADVMERVVSDSVEIEFDETSEAALPAPAIADVRSPVREASQTPRAEVTRFADERSTPSRGTPIRVSTASATPPPVMEAEEAELELELDEGEVEEDELELGDVEVEPPEIELQSQELELQQPPAPASIPLPRSPEPPPVVLPSTGFAARVPTPAPAPRVESVPEPAELDFSFAAPAANSYVVGEHRVILHTSEGHVKRGIVRDVDLLSAEIPLHTQPGQPPEAVSRDRLKAIFFMLTAGEPQPAPEGSKIRITFSDGRQVAGYASGHRSGAGGFFMVPADNRTNTARIFVYRPSVQAVFEG